MGDPRRIGLVLLSGGMDSVLLVHDALTRFEGVEAVHFSYGQPSEAAEWEAAQRVAERRGVHLHRAVIRDSVMGVPLAAPPPGHNRGVSLANMPARNLVFIATAASLAGQRWGDPAAWRRGESKRVTILLGPVFDDVAMFPDCRRAFQKAAAQAVCEALTGIVDCSVDYPFWNVPKGDLLRMFHQHRPEALADVRDLSMSCYAGTDCGTCDACRVRAAAFQRAGLVDR